MANSEAPKAPAGSPAGSDDHRRKHRTRTLKEARVVLSDWTSIDCLVKDITAEGARLMFKAPTSLPKTFDLHILSTNTTSPAELLWQRGLSAGVAFSAPGRAAASRKP